MLQLAPELFPDVLFILQQYLFSLARVLEQVKRILKRFLFYVCEELINRTSSVDYFTSGCKAVRHLECSSLAVRSLGARMILGASATPGAEHGGSCTGSFLPILVHFLARGGMAHRLPLRPKLAL